MMISFCVYGAPRTKKNSPSPVPAKTADGRSFTRILPSKAYRQWFKVAMQQSPCIKLQLRAAGACLPITGDVRCSAVIHRERNTGDMLGYLEALADWLQEPVVRKGKLARDGAGIIADDRQIISWDGSRMSKDSARPRIEVCIEALCDGLASDQRCGGKGWE